MQVSTSTPFGLRPKPFLADIVDLEAVQETERDDTATFADFGQFGRREGELIAVGVTCAFVGAHLSAQHLAKATLEVVRVPVAFSRFEADTCKAFAALTNLCSMRATDIRRVCIHNILSP